jgi:hypothetical protein
MLISEKRDIQINELVTTRGHHDTNPMGDFFSEVSSNLTPKELRKVFRKYYTKKVPQNISPISDEKIDNFFYFLQYGHSKPSGLRNFLTYDIVTGLAYYIAKKYFKIKSGGFGIEYVKVDDNDGDKTFYFFDTAFKIFIGKISIEKKKEKSIKGNLYKVSTAAAEKKLIGMGYGLKMYFTILEYCDYLMSDSILFSGSFRIWSQILPKYVNVWWVSETDNKIVKITPESPLDEKTEDIDFFVASMYHKKV